MFREYMRRLIVCSASLALYGFGNFISVKAGSAGTNSWNTLALGISDLTGMRFGVATFLIGLAIILIDFIGKGKLGIGTLLNAILIPAFSEFFLSLFAAMPEASSAALGAVYTLLGQTIISFATILYMKPMLGCGPRDTLLVIVGRRFPKWPIGSIKFCIEIAVLAVGVLLGAPFGIGTVLVMALQATIFQFACKVCRYEPRDIIHEDFADTIRRIRSAF